jgi:glycosyltransferase involved in cell wall biosynthesis
MMPHPGEAIPHIVVVTGQHMVANPRVWKEANTLVGAGYRVTILTVNHDPAKTVQDRKLLDPAVQYKPVVNLARGRSSFSDVYLSRIRRRLAFTWKKYFNVDGTRLLAYRPAKLLKAALAARGDLYICHQETGLIIGNALLKKGKNVAFDVEDWYSRDYVNPLRAVKLLERIESEAFRRASYITCPSRTMSEAIASHYGLSTKPEVLYNGFSMTEGSPSGFKDIVPQKDSMIWFSQVIGPARGLENLVRAMGAVTSPMKIHLAGDVDPGYRHEIESGLSNTRHEVFFHRSMPHKDLVPFLAGFGIGLALESNETESRDTTISNKILQYIQAGNCIIATNTKGQMEVASSIPDRIRIVDVRDPLDWARQIESLNRSCVRDPESFEKSFIELYSWEAQEPKLLSLVKKAIQ